MTVIEVVLRTMLFLTGVGLVVWTLLSAIRSFVLPRSVRDKLARLVFIGTRKLFEIRLRGVNAYAERDRIMAYYAPISLMALLPTWYILVMIGYALMYRAIGVDNLYLAFRESVSSLLTLGFQPVEGLWMTALVFTEGMLGLIMVALLLAYLPTIYAAFSRREAAVSLLEVRAGSPPSVIQMLVRYQRIHGLDRLTEVWRTWEIWFADIEESHTSLGALAFFRSQQRERSWVTAAGAVLDAAAITLSVVDLPDDPQAALCIRGGFLALRHIADFFDIHYDSNPRPDDPISIRREEFDAVCAALETEGVPLRTDRDLAWRSFAGWRVNYDRVLLSLAQMTMAPYAPWSSDRAPI